MQVERVVSAFKIAADPARAKVLDLLRHTPRLNAKGKVAGYSKVEKSVGELCAATERNQPAISHHLSFMRAAGLVDTRRSGKNVFYSLTAAGKSLVAAMDLVSDTEAAPVAEDTIEVETGE